VPHWRLGHAGGKEQVGSIQGQVEHNYREESRV
jgi:hypothetical protein